MDWLRRPAAQGRPPHAWLDGVSPLCVWQIVEGIARHVIEGSTVFTRHGVAQAVREEIFAAGLLAESWAVVGRLGRRYKT